LFVDIANFKAIGIIPEDMDWQQKKKLFKEANQYVWDDPYLLKIGVDNLLRRCVTSDEAKNILCHCHNSPYGGRFNGERTAAKVLESGFFWPTIFKDAHMHVQHYDNCQRTGNISKGHDWGIDFIGLLPSSFFNEYIVEYVSRWVEVIPTQKSDSKTNIIFLKKHIFCRFGTPRVLISDGGAHFCNTQLKKVLEHHGVRHRITTTYHP